MEISKRFGSSDSGSTTTSLVSLPSNHFEHHAPVIHKKSTASNNLYGLDKETYKQIKQVTHRLLVSEMRLDKLTHIDLTDPKKKEELKEQIIEKIGSIFDSQGFMFRSRTDRADLIRELANEALGLGPMEDLLFDPTITEIMVNGINKIYVEQEGKIKLLNKTFTDEKQLRVVIDRIVNPIGRRIDESSPYVDARLHDGSRVNIIIPPLAIDGPSITIRKFPSRRLLMDDFIKFNTISQDMAEFLAACVNAKLNIFISGGTGSGKTTLLNILSSFIPNDERIVTIEDAAELRLNQDHVVRLESKPANIEGKGAVTIRDLVKNSLRMRPDRIVIGEIRGGEALDMLQAMNTGHDGSLATGHANTPRDALSRIETMVLMAGVEIPVRAIREQIASAINIVVQQNRMKDGSRKITKIVEITGMEGDIISTQEIFSYDVKGVDERGNLIGGFNCSKIRPKILDSFEARGSKIPAVFTPERVIARLRENK
ncbi:MAG: CpaF family protein [Candidatus Sericytochromatia bacterium]